MTKYPKLFSVVASAFVFLTIMLVITLLAPVSDIYVRHYEGITPVMVAGPAAAPATEAGQAPPPKTLSILFIGNSYTFYNNMPGMLVLAARSDPGIPVVLEVQAVTRGAVALKDFWASGEARQVLRQRKWDYVVIQEHSYWAFQKGNILESTAAALNWAQDAVSVGAKPVVFMNWPRQPGSAWYSDPASAFLKNPDYSYKRFHDQTAIMARRVNAAVVPVGDYWYYAVQEHPELELYEDDGSHPAQAGSFLTALVLYHHFTGRPPEATTYTPPDVSAEHAQIIRKIAAYGG